ncbi:MMPL family transporter [Solirubrobacter deserti]|uniref:MMPL family transporter n=1 Tax=Solirubrobacter deserti TaxID=2282478 RepID=A0ABT4RLL4_9ACTN|nr:MMPL family transporter [Solirubrobacter deserti]MDA0139370.1 MMPL family transporter [Solirubrobacter deserti]
MLQRLGQISASRPWRTLLVLLVFIVLAGVIGGPVAGRMNGGDGFTPPDAESSQATAQLERATGEETSPGVILLVRGDDAAAQAAAGGLAAVPGVARAEPGPPSTDGDSRLVMGTLRAGVDDEEVAADAVAAFEGRDDVVVGGGAVAGLQLSETISADLGRAELFAFPLLFLLSLLFFRGRAAVLPLVVGITTVLGTFLVLSGVNLAYSLNVFALNLVIGLGLGLAIDYTLFLLTRFREELSKGAEPREAVATTMRTAGRTVVFSAATVAAALGTLTLFPLGFAESMGLAGASVAIVAGLASLAVSPALLALWGHKLARKESAAASGRWHRIAHGVMRRPGVIAVATAAVMLVVALPALSVNWTPVGADAVPTGNSARTLSDASEAEFGGAATTPVTMAVTAPESAAGEVETYAARFDAPARYLGSNTWAVNVEAPGDAVGEQARALVDDIRTADAPFPVAVTGPAAEFVDQQATISGRLPLALAALAALTFVLLWLMTGSIVLPLKAIVMNALTVGAALAPLVFLYDGVEPTNFLVSAALIFALSTDYGVFLLGRIKEARDTGETEREAVAVGIARTGRVVTAAAILLAVAIGAFSTSAIPFIQQIGIAVAFGVLIDAFVVRSLLVPSLMALLGKWNWWSPKPLRRLHERVGISEEGREAVPA